MINLLRFEIKRSKRIILILVGMMMLCGVLLLLIDPDHEELVITISILNFLLPFILIVTMGLVHIIEDMRLDTKNLYLTTPKSNAIKIKSKICFAMMNYVVFFIMIVMFMGGNVVGSYAPYIAVSCIVFGVFIELAVLLFNIHSKK
ncbi:MAG: hypothetical protein JXN65_02775 [Clostridia bacterium]|nr:hypothetical protein [Clostridia bacterium]